MRHVLSYITFAYFRQISYDLSRIDCVPQYDRMIAATNESEVIDISPDLPLVREEDLVVELCSAPSVPQPVFTITEKAPTRAFSLLKAPTTALTLNTVLRLMVLTDWRIVCHN